MKKKLCLLLICLCMISVSACGNKVESDSPAEVEAIVEAETTVETDTEGNDSGKSKIKIEDIVWNVDEGIINGGRGVLLDYTNNTPYTIASFEITFKEKSDITEDDKTVFYADIQKMMEADDEKIEELKEHPISMHVETVRVTEPKESVTNVRCRYYTGIYYVQNIEHYNLVEPDIATVKYIDEDKIYTIYYDYGSGKYSVESETEKAYQWAQMDLGDKIPKPDVKIVGDLLDTEALFMFDAYGMSLEQFNDYVEECKTFGYTVEADYYEGFYTADNGEGYNIYMFYDEDDYSMSVTLEAPDEEAEECEEDEIDDMENEDADEELVDGMRPEFKEAMDSYEAFYDEYCDFMKKYMKNPSDLELIDEYMDMLEKSEEITERFAEWDGKKMNSAESKYYIEVSSRVSQKMIDVAISE